MPPVGFEITCEMEKCGDGRNEETDGKLRYVLGFVKFPAGPG